MVNPERPSAPVIGSPAASLRSAIILLTTVFLLCPLAVAQDDPPCDDAVASAETSYYAGQFQDAIDLLNHCISTSAFAQDETEAVYSLLGKVYWAHKQEEQSREAIRILLTRVPDYRPVPAYEPPDFIALVEDVRQATGKVPGTVEKLEPIMLASNKILEVDFEPPPFTPVPTETFSTKRNGMAKWFAIGGGAIAASVTVLVLAGGGDNGSMIPDGPTLPLPPAFPGQ